MSEVMNEKKEILLETGTNEFEIVEFTVNKVNYGINVAKVREVINSSLINEEMRRKGELIGANGQVSKPEIAQLIGLLDTESL